MKSLFTGLFLALLAPFILTSCVDSTAQSQKMKTYPNYEPSDLGLNFTADAMVLRVWAPTVEAVKLRLYEHDLGDAPPAAEFSLSSVESGVWKIELDSEYRGLYYTLQAKHADRWSQEVPDPYVKAVGRNGKRGQLIDPSRENPSDWEKDQRPDFSDLKPNDFLVYELHVRDFSIAENSGMKNKGKFLAFQERGTTNSAGLSTGIDHLLEMGVTHVHLLPSFDFYTVDETRLDEPQYNWGYDPQNYNVPEGSYSTDPADGSVRIREFKQMVQAFHEAGIAVVMDVVYNHTSRTNGLSFEELVPGYYYRHWSDSTLSNASGCGNETASEQPMMRKFMVESLKYWVEEYHIDGFRFDLMAIHDLETMKEISSELHKLNPDILLYGEGWTAADSPLPREERALKSNTYLMPKIAAFSDEIRDGLKGHWSDHKSKGFVSGKTDLAESVKFGIVGGVNHPQIDYKKVNNSKGAWAAEPHQCMVYVSCHDNHTLFDKLKIANPDATEEEIRRMHLLSNFVVLTSQGVPFLHAGVEFLRTKDGVENSYKSPDSVNLIDWNRKTRYRDHFDAYQKLIEIRKAHPSFRLDSANEIREKLSFLETEDGVLAYEIQSPEKDMWKRVLVIANGNNEKSEFTMPEGDWHLIYPSSGLNLDFVEGELDPISGYILAELRN